MLQLLLEAGAGTFVSLEVFEDVGSQSPATGIVASQTKSGLVRNPISDGSPELWKTLANWLTMIDDGAFDGKNTVFEIYVAKRHRAGIAQLFHDASSRDAAASAITEARRRRIKTKGGIGAEARDSQSFMDRVLNAPDGTLVDLVVNFRLTFAIRDPLSDVQRLVASKWVRPESVKMVTRHALGWIKERTDALLQARQPVIVSSDEFNAEMLAFLPRCDFRHILISMAGMPTPSAVAAERIRLYVRQIEIIELSDEDIIQAINDYLRSCVERTSWSTAGIVHEQSFEEFEGALVAFWRNKRRQNALTHTGLSPIEQGQLLLSDCCIKEQKLQGLEVPSFFTAGSYHALSDELEVGWHPDYKAQLDGAKCNGDS